MNFKLAYSYGIFMLVKSRELIFKYYLGDVYLL